MDDIWKLIYDSFEKMPMSGIRPALGINTGRNDLQFSLQKTISEYKHGPRPELLDQIMSDIMVANATGYISNEACSALEKLIEKERTTKWHSE